MHKLLFYIGITFTFCGLFFALQGAGYIPWPPSSFMVNQMPWTYYGGAIALVGLFLIWLARR